MLGRYWGAKAHATGEPLDVQAVHVWDLKGGKAVRFQQYVDTLHFAGALGAD
jgi:ketosteroid isomerase-like protein